MLTVLDRGVGGRFGPSCLYETPKLAELSYQLLYVLSANKDTSGPTLRYLRTAHDFLFRHLQHVPFQLQDTGTQQEYSCGIFEITNIFTLHVYQMYM